MAYNHIDITCPHCFTLLGLVGNSQGVLLKCPAIVKTDTSVVEYGVNVRSNKDWLIVHKQKVTHRIRCLLTYESDVPKIVTEKKCNGIFTVRLK